MRLIIIYFIFLLYSFTVDNSYLKTITPDNVLGFIPLYGVIPYIKIWIWEFFNIWIVTFLIVFFYYQDKNSKTYAHWIVRKHNVQLLDGETGSWKTRLLTEISSDARQQEQKLIVISNFYNAYSDFYFASLQDFKLLQIDIARLWEFSNFDDNEKKEIEKAFPGYFAFLSESEFKNKIKKIKNTYNILTLGDEFYAYFHNRNFMGNFSKKDWWDELLLNLHQTRHSNQTVILASQDDDNLDLDFRQIAHNEINVFSMFGDLIFWFNKYKYLSKKKQKEDGIEFKKINMFPTIFINWFELSRKINLIKSISFFIYNLFLTTHITGKYLKNIHFIKIKKIIFIEKIYFEKKHLKFYSKFNVKKNINVYKPGYIYDYIIKKEKEFDKQKEV